MKFHLNFCDPRLSIKVGSRHPFQTQKYKGFPKIYKGRRILASFSKMDDQFRFLRSRWLFRHQDRHICLTSYLFVICVICHNMTNYLPFNTTIRPSQTRSKINPICYGWRQTRKDKKNG